MNCDSFPNIVAQSPREIWYNSAMKRCRQEQTEPVRVAVIFDRNLKSGRDIVAGIYRYAGMTRDWELFLFSKTSTRAELTAAVRRLGPAGFLVDGELAMLAPQLAKDFPDAPIVAVDGLPSSMLKNYASVHLLCDDAPISREAGRLLVRRGFRSFGFVGTTDIVKQKPLKGARDEFQTDRGCSRTRLGCPNTRCRGLPQAIRHARAGKVDHVASQAVRRDGL